MSSDDYIRKSMLESFDFCPQSFFKQWVMKNDKEPNYKMLVGSRFHEFANTFFDYYQVVDPNHWKELIPEEFNEEEVDMGVWFLNYQLERYAQLNLENRLNEFAPIYKELFMQCDSMRLKSTLDGAEWISKRDDTIRLVEYKTGSRLDVDAAYRQLAFYAVLWTLNGNPGQVVKLRLVNPRLHAWAECDYTKELAETALKRVVKLRDAIDRSYFPYKCTDGKFAACKLCSLEELPKLFPDDGMDRFSDIYKESPQRRLEHE
jgi:hypothetical protein